MRPIVIAAGLAVCGVLFAVGALASTWGEGYRELLDGLLVHPGQSWSAACPQLGYGWLLLLPLVPLLAQLFVFVSPRSVEEQARAQEARAERRERRAEARAQKHADGAAPLTARAGEREGSCWGCGPRASRRFRAPAAGRSSPASDRLNAERFRPDARRRPPAARVPGRAVRRLARRRAGALQPAARGRPVPERGRGGPLPAGG